MSQTHTPPIKETERQYEEREIDLMEIVRKLWQRRKLIYKVCGGAALFGLLIAFSIPKEYTTRVKVSLERTTGRSGGSLSSLAAMAGINLSSSSSDALSDQIYPEVMNSTPFLIDLFHVKVQNEDSVTTLFNYLLNDYRTPWWNIAMRGIFSVPSRIIGIFKEKKGEEERIFAPSNLTKRERKVITLLKENLILTVDNKTGVMDLSVTMQNPVISAQITDTILVNLQNYITTYRTNKARKDLAYSKTLYQEAKTAYTEAQDKYAHFTDANQNIFLHSYRAEQERLQNEMNLTYQIYSQTTQQLQAAKAKVQENTPAFVVIQPSVVPLKPSKPHKMLLLVGCIFLGFAGSCAWIYLEAQFTAWKKLFCTSETIKQKEGKA